MQPEDAAISRSGNATLPSQAEPADQRWSDHDGLERLADLPRGRTALVAELAVDSGLAHRLGALGLRPGQQVQVLRRAPWSGPIHLQVGMTELMLRHREAARIRVRLSPAPERTPS